ncbi:uncharacterized protein LOC134760589 [Pongo abelii]|uniref:uncharacterized protein LOC134760589 n=1 Tax=Pongo abelii TaxID=9601 RepID=UPI0001D626E7
MAASTWLPTTSGSPSALAAGSCRIGPRSIRFICAALASAPRPPAPRPCTTEGKTQRGVTARAAHSMEPVGAGDKWEPSPFQVAMAGTPQAQLQLPKEDLRPRQSCVLGSQEKAGAPPSQAQLEPFKPQLRTQAPLHSWGLGRPP